MMQILAYLFTSEVLLALGAVISAAAIDAVLTAVLAVQGKLGAPFSWKKLPQFLVTNVLWPAVGFVVAGILLKYAPDMKEPYLVAVAGVTAWLAKDWRGKFNLLIGITLPKQAGGETQAPPQQ